MTTRCKLAIRVRPDGAPISIAVVSSTKRVVAEIDVAEIRRVIKQLDDLPHAHTHAEEFEDWRAEHEG
jgi:hypothetical protein